jgi:hypothetical protein
MRTVQIDCLDIGPGRAWMLPKKLARYFAYRTMNTANGNGNGNEA